MVTSNYIKQNPISFGILLILGCLLSFSPFPWDRYQFLLTAGVPILYFTYLLLSRKKTEGIQLVSSDIAWLLFLGIGLGSYNWAIDGALVWREFFSWSSLVLWMLLFRSLSHEVKFIQRLEQLLLGLCFFFLIQSVLFFLVYSTIFNSSVFLEKVAQLLHLEITNFLDKDIYRWHKFFGYNANVVALHVLSLYPFLLFYQSKSLFFTFLKWICGIWLLFFIYKAGSQGVLIAFALLLLYFIWATYRPKYLWSVLVTIGIGLFMTGYIFSNGDISLANNPLLSSLTQPGSLGNRIHPIINSVRVWLDAPILGYGFGNWHLIAFKYDNLDLGELFKSVDPLKGVIDFRLLKSHNIYSKYLVELGILGFTAFLYPFGMSLCQLRKKTLQLTTFQKALGGLLIIYLSAAFFYRNANSFPDYFSRIQLLTFCALGILTNVEYRKYLVSKWISVLFITLALGNFSWYLYEHTTNYRYESALSIMKNNPTQGIQEIASIYHPIFKTTYKEETSLAFQLAKLYSNQGDYDNAEKHYTLGLKSAPYNEEILSNFANFLLKTGRDIPRAKAHAQKVFATNNRNQFEMLFTLAEIAIIEKDYQKARHYLNERYNNYLKHPQRHRIMLLEKELYFGNSTYLNQVVDLTVSQKIAIAKMSARYGISDNSIKAQLERLSYLSNNNTEIRREDVLISRELSQLLTKEQFALFLKDKLGNH